MPTSGPNNPTIASGADGIGYKWLTPNNCFSSNDVYAIISGDNVETPSLNLFASGFAFSIPADDIIDGIQVDIEWHRSGPGSGNNAQLYVGNTTKGPAKSIAGNLPTVDGTENIGGAADDWSAGLRGSDVSTANFGVGIKLEWDLADGLGSGLIDHIQMTLTHSAGGEERTQVSAGNSVIYKSGYWSSQYGS